MTTLLVVLLIAGLLGSSYSYFIYPLLLGLLPKRKRNAGDPAMAAETLPEVSVIVACYNEEAQLAEKLDDTLSNGYPLDRLEIIVASDQSTDRTHEIAQGYADQHVRLVISDRRLGKEHAQGLALSQAKGAIIVFTDAGAKMSPGSILQITKRLREPEIGAVSSEDKVLSADGRPVGEGLYQKYEMWIRRIESEKLSLIGLTGALFAARRQACEPWDATVDSDFNTALNCIRNGLVAVSDPSVQCLYQDLGDDRREYQRKVRTMLRGMTCLARHREMLNPIVRPAVSWQLWSHKIGRYLVPLFMGLLLATTAITLCLAVPDWLFRVSLGLMIWQIAFYAIALTGMLWHSSRRWTPIRVVSFFMMANTAALQAGLLFLRGKRISVWNPSQRA
ncbi:glycosyltransferase family 2 protein [Roseiconus lacunae]|uniref:Glycosyltransferase family 2 protein n=1 Tax=Roseiconus lacunae TaxID=2605694 RepID=A0ABT7PQP7_9BACT|nr:glycosyltransferase family 2 protein [Roseiconus lacunae]MDM4018839.1 glycosyltransferase family 2 protein [Roseiconus lacunae]